MESSGSGDDDDVIVVVVVEVEVEDGVVDGATQLEPCGWMIVGLEVVTGVLEDVVVAECDIALLLRVVVLVLVMMILVLRSFVRSFVRSSL